MPTRREESRLPAGFSRLLISWFAAQSADGMRFAGLPLLAFVTDRSPVAVATVATATSLPWLLVALPAGLLVDRLDASRVIVAANLTRAVAAALVVVAVATGAVSIAVLAVIGFALTAAETFTDSAAQSLLVEMVPTEQLERANARFLSSENVGFDLIGPLAAAGLFLLAHWAPFAVSAAVFATAAAVMVGLTGGAGQRLGGPDADPGAPGRGTVDPGGVVDPDDPAIPAAPERLRSSVGRAFAAVFADPVLRSLVITVAVLAATVAAVEGVLVIYVTGPLNLKPAVFPVLLASYSLGLLAAAPFAGRVVQRFETGAVMLCALGVAATSLMVLGAFPSTPVALVCFVILGATLGFWNILSATRRQRRTPRRITAAVSSAFRTMAWGALPLGAALGGVGAQHWGVARVFFVAGVIVLLLALVMARPFLRPVDSGMAGPGVTADSPVSVPTEAARPE
ncbi:MFS transporter [Nakamurella sp. PAMC28650]|uniref:MFS transporter n=1 Tax=Nakamurella sp. PAMC28650 TaxID=2762325 RepID=UPI00164DE8C8|nr:MFS transporter [Nakamurella sp. PAMC28650]QNK80493.1 MFS transporter [Nakamurella sp. PAMC28650]